MSLIDQDTGSAANPITETGVLGGTTIVVTHDTLTPLGQDPTAYLAADAVLGSVNIYSENGAVVVVSEPVNALGAVNLYADTGTIEFGAADIGALSATNLLIENGGTAIASEGTLVGLLNGGSLSFGDGGGTLDITPGTGLLNLSAAQAISGFKAGDTVIDGAVNYADVASYTVTNSGGSQIVTFLDGNGTSLGSMAFSNGTFAQTGSFPQNGGPLLLMNGPGGNVEVAACFLTGTNIAAAGGERAVETLRPGDLVETVVAGESVLRPLIWVGRRTVAVSRDAADDCFPVQILAGAFADDCPRRDLAVTADHCIFTDGVLVPARMLVNGGSIRFAREMNVFTYYHVELERHAILRAEGLLTESYLDTGNRAAFDQGLVTLNPAPVCKTWGPDAVAPLAVNRAQVEPVWRRLQARAHRHGVLATPGVPAPKGGFDVHLLTDEGIKIMPYQRAGTVYGFALPAGVAGLRLMSRTARPSDVIGPFVDDRRSLGVLAGEITMVTSSGSLVADAHLTAGVLAGWHAPEGGAYRWTAGCAMLPLDFAALGGAPGLLKIELVKIGPFEANSPMQGTEIAA